MAIVKEKSLLVGLKASNTYAFEHIYRTYRNDLYNYVSGKLNSSDMCDDIIHDVFISLWERREYLEVNVSLRGYLYGAIKFKIVDEFRKNNNYLKYKENQVSCSRSLDDLSADYIDNKTRLIAARRAIENLPSRMREVFELSRFENLPVNKIAERLSISPQTVKNQLSKALAILRRKGCN